MREIERQVMLQIIDQRWREHLYEMDYLQEGINLRAMGQKDPLVEWQREGFEMFGQMMHGIAQDFVQYVMHVAGRSPSRSRPQAERRQRAVLARPTTRSEARQRHAQAAAAAGAGRRLARRRAGRAAAPPTEPVATAAGRASPSGTRRPRNAPCPCGAARSSSCATAR